MTWLIVAAFVALLIIATSFDKHERQKSQKDDESIEDFISGTVAGELAIRLPEKDASEELIMKAQDKFESAISNWTPTRPSGKEIYIYKNLMKPWFDKLAAKNRYQGSINTVRNDWVDYLNAVLNRNSDMFLVLEMEDEEDKTKYDEDIYMASHCAKKIEEAFANQIDEDAVHKLKFIRELESLGSFSRNGEIAPEGHTYDANDNLVKSRK